MQSQATAKAPAKPVIYRETKPVRLAIVAGCVCRVTINQLRDLRANDHH